MSEFLIGGGAVVGYIFIAGIVGAVISGGDLDDLEDDWVFAAAWPVTLVMLAIVGVFMLPVGIYQGIGATADFLADRKERRDRLRSDRAAELEREIARLERENEIGGQR